MLLLKRHYRDGGDAARKVNSGVLPHGTDKQVSHVEVQKAGGVHHFTPRTVNEGTADGWMTLGKGQITLHTAEGEDDVVYRIKRIPGTYCCHCGMKLPDGIRPEPRLEHINTAHLGKKSPDPSNPAGYEVIHYYDCEKED